MGWRADGGLWLLVRGGGLYLSKGTGGLETDENVGRRIGKAVESRMGPYERALLEMQNLLASWTNSLQGRVPNLERFLTSDDDVDDEELREDDLYD